MSNNNSNYPECTPWKREKRTTLEKYGFYVGKTIGYGSFSKVKQAFSRHDSCQVAIKIVNKKRARENILEKFLPREVQAVKAVKHKNIINYLNCIETPNKVYLVMDLARRGSLLDIVQTDGRVPECQARIWFAQMLDAVEYCHSIGWVHRDLKLENILIDEMGNVRLTDFGFARPWVQNTKETLDLSRTFCGSYTYASPEILQGIPYDPRKSDIWSLGIVLYGMTFGRLPYDDSSRKELLRQVARKLTFPMVDFQVTQCVTNLLEQILVPADQRPSINKIRKSIWMSTALLSKSYPRT